MTWVRAVSREGRSQGRSIPAAVRAALGESARTSRAPVRRAPPDAERESSSLASSLLIARELSFFTESHFQEDEQQGTGQPGRDQHDREDFARHSPNQGGARGARDDQGGGEPERQNARARGHRSNGTGPDGNRRAGFPPARQDPCRGEASGGSMIDPEGGCPVIAAPSQSCTQRLYTERKPSSSGIVRKP